MHTLPLSRPLPSGLLLAALMLAKRSHHFASHGFAGAVPVSGPAARSVRSAWRCGHPG